MLYGPIKVDITVRGDVVLILIFLENALRRRSLMERQLRMLTVLILIFLENALRQSLFFIKAQNLESS